MTIENIKKVKDKNASERILYLRQKKYFGKFDALLDGSKTGSLWLKDNRIAKNVSSSIIFYDKKRYNLFSYCIMPNHVHMLFELIGNEVDFKKDEEKYIVTKILKSIKINSALKANKILGRNGQFWHRESYDHVVRGEKEFENILRYILMNPQNAGLVKFWKDWKWTYSYIGETL